MPIPSLPLRGSPSLGLPETPQVGYLVIIPIHQHEHDKKGAGLPGQLIAGHMDQAKSQKAAGCCCDLVPVDGLYYQRPELPLVFQPSVCCVFMTTKRNNQRLKCKHQGGVFNIIRKAVKAVNITEKQTEKRRMSLGQVWGKETDLILQSTQPGGHRDSLVSTIGAQPAETWCPDQGSCHPRCRVLGRGSPWRLWTCDPRCRIWGRGSPWRLWMCDPRCRVWGRGSPWRLWTCDPRCRVWGRQSPWRLDM